MGGNESDGVRRRLLSLRDEGFRDFQSKLIPNVDPAQIIGVRTPDLRRLAREMLKEGLPAFLNELPHEYFEESQLHAFIISEIKDFDLSLSETGRFLPFIDNWATCDQLSPKAFRKNRPALLSKVKEWILSKRAYTARFAIGNLMRHFLDEDFSPEYLEMVAAVDSEEYYVRMMAAWYFATALAKRWEAALIFIKERRLEPWTHNKAIQKACESLRISAEQKEELRGMRVERGCARI